MARPHGAGAARPASRPAARRHDARARDASTHAAAGFAPFIRYSLALTGAAWRETAWEAGGRMGLGDGGRDQVGVPPPPPRPAPLIPAATDRRTAHRAPAAARA